MRWSAIALMAALAGIIISSEASAAPASEAALIDQCAIELALAPAKCACILDTSKPELSDQQYDYLLVRLARDDAEIARMRTFMGLLQRLAILGVIVRIADICAPDKPFNLPAS